MHFIEREINKLVKKNKTRDPFELCDLENIHCIVMDLHTEINGLYQYVQRNKFIYINSNLSEEEKKAICGHELGHAILHKKLNCTFLKKLHLYKPKQIRKRSKYLFCPTINP